MKLKAQLSGIEHQVSLDIVSGVAAAEIDGRHHEVEVRELARGEYLLVSGTKVYKCRVAQRRDAHALGKSFEIVLRGDNYNVAIIDPKRLRSGQSSGPPHTGAAEIVSPMPGKIVRILVSAGANVAAGRRNHCG